MEKGSRNVKKIGELRDVGRRVTWASRAKKNKSHGELQDRILRHLRQFTKIIYKGDAPKVPGFFAPILMSVASSPIIHATFKSGLEGAQVPHAPSLPMIGRT